MAEYIDREVTLENIKWHMDKFPECAECLEIALKGMVREIPAADVVSAAAYKQAVWERDTAIAQLNEIGKGLGEEMDDVLPVKRGRWTHDGSNWQNRWVCSECGFKLFEAKTKYCSGCGAKMGDET